jgi:hypothetical protein
VHDRADSPHKQPLRWLATLCVKSGVLGARRTVPNYLSDHGLLPVKSQHVCPTFETSREAFEAVFVSWLWRRFHYSN